MWGKTMDKGEASIADAVSSDVAPEQRFAPRRRKQIPALLYIESVVNAVSCQIVDISTTGARVVMKSGWDSAFKHYSMTAGRVRLVERVEKVAYDCMIIRRGDTELGLKFLAAPILPAVPVKKPTPAK